MSHPHPVAPQHGVLGDSSARCHTAMVCVCVSPPLPLTAALAPFQLLEIIRKEDVVLRAILTTHHHW